MPRTHILPAWTMRCGHLNRRAYLLCNRLCHQTPDHLATMLRTLPDAFSNAVMRPMRIACNTSSGISPPARYSPTWQNNSVSLVLSKMGLTIAHFKFFVNRSWSKLNKIFRTHQLGWHGLPRHLWRRRN